MAGPRRRWTGRLARLAFWLVGVTLFLVLPLRWLPPVVTSFMAQDWLGQASFSARVHYTWVDRDRISRHAARAVLAAEDQKFFEHHGFDLVAIRQALADTRDGSPTRGASTISQQVAKNLWLWPGRSWFRKGLEAWLTLWIELLWPKERILEVYLNVAQFGPGIYGVEAAAHTYFGKPASRLNPSEAARLAAVLPNPVRFRAARPSNYVLRRQGWIESHARRMGGLDTAAWANP
jgi:monofunctional biosynthetic peptidoglycan transglycosylase